MLLQNCSHHRVWMACYGEGLGCHIWIITWNCMRILWISIWCKPYSYSSMPSTLHFPVHALWINMSICHSSCTTGSVPLFCFDGTSLLWINTTHTLKFIWFSPGGFDPANPVLPRLPQGSKPAHVQESGRPLWTHQPAPPHGRSQETQTQFLTAKEKHPITSSYPPFQMKSTFIFEILYSMNEVEKLETCLVWQLKRHETREWLLIYQKWPPLYYLLCYAWHFWAAEDGFVTALMYQVVIVVVVVIVGNVSNSKCWDTGRHVFFCFFMNLIQRKIVNV